MPAPKFIPDGDPLLSGAPKFISDEDMQALTPRKRAKTPAFQSALEGAGQGLSLGYSDELEGALRGAGSAITGEGPLTGEALLNEYRRYRDKARARQELARQDNPGSYMAGEVAGGVGTSFIPGLGWMNASKGASLAQKLMAAGKSGAAIAGGMSNADLTKNETGEFLDDVKGGALTGAAFAGGLDAAGRLGGSAMKALGERLKDMPEQRAVKAVTGQNISALRQMAGTTLKSAGDVDAANAGINKIGRDILEEAGVLTPLSSVEDLAPRLSEARQKYGSLIGQVGEEIDKAVPKAVDAKKIANKIYEYADSIPETLQGQRLRDKLVDEAANFENIQGLTFADAQKFKNQFKFKPVDSDALISNQDATNKIRSIITKEMDETADAVAKMSPELQELIGNYRGYKSKYGSFKSASDAATDRVQKNLTNRFVSPSDYGVGSSVGLASALASGGADFGTLLLGAGAAGVNKFARERGSALAAKTGETLRNAYNSPTVQGAMRTAGPILDKANVANIATQQTLTRSNPDALINAERSERGGQTADLGQSVRSFAASPLTPAKWKTALTAAEARGPEALAAAFYTLSQRDPEFMSTYRQFEDEKEAP